MSAFWPPASFNGWRPSSRSHRHEQQRTWKVVGEGDMSSAPLDDGRCTEVGAAQVLANSSSFAPPESSPRKTIPHLRSGNVKKKDETRENRMERLGARLHQASRCRLEGLRRRSAAQASVALFSPSCCCPGDRQPPVVPFTTKSYQLESLLTSLLVNLHKAKKCILKLPAYSLPRGYAECHNVYYLMETSLRLHGDRAPVVAVLAS
jgi:hypothetical protein